MVKQSDQRRKRYFLVSTLEERYRFFYLYCQENYSMKVMKAFGVMVASINIENSGLLTVPLSHVAGLDIKELHSFENNINNALEANMIVKDIMTSREEISSHFSNGNS